MNKKIIILIIIIFIVIGAICWYYYSRHIKILDCREQCMYLAEPEGREGGGSRIYIPGHNSYWFFLENYEKFETQEECVNYCLNR